MNETYMYCDNLQSTYMYKTFKDSFIKNSFEWANVQVSNCPTFGAYCLFFFFLFVVFFCQIFFSLTKKNIFFSHFFFTKS